MLVLPATMWAGDGPPADDRADAADSSLIDILTSVMLDDRPYPTARGLPAVPKDGSVALGVVVYGGHEREGAKPDAVLPLPADALLRAGGMIEGFADSERARLGSFAARRHVLLVLTDETGSNDGGGHDWASLASARDRLVGRRAPGERPVRECSLVDQVSVIGLGVSRDLLFDHVADSVEQFGPIDGERNLGIAASVEPADVILHGRNNIGTPRPPVQEVPITTIDSALTARLVAKRVKALGFLRAGGSNQLDGPMRLAAAYFENGGPSNWPFTYAGSIDYRSVLFLTDDIHDISGSFACEPKPCLTAGSLAALINNVTAPGQVFGAHPVTIHQSNAIALDSNSTTKFNRDAAKIHMENSNWRYPTVDNEKNLGIVAEALDPAGFAWTSPQYLDVLHRMISRLTVCPSDYNRDGVSNSANPGADWTPFLNDYLSNVPYSDWNFSGVPNPLGGSASNKADGAKFQAGFNAGCPNN